jgi:hypothetical protein
LSAPAQGEHRKFTRTVVDPVAYAHRSGVPGAARFQNPWVTDPKAYESQLRDKWHDLLERNRVLCMPEDWAALLLTAGLTVYLPKKCTEDGDNALLYIVDLLEIARRELLGDDAGEKTLDELLVEVSFKRTLDTGVWIWLSPTDHEPPYSWDYMGDGTWSGPFDPDAL